MASPFEIFRKNQRVLMAAAVFIAIVSFVIAPMIEYFSGGNVSNRKGPNPVIASWKGGSVRAQQLELDQRDVQLLNRFLRELSNKVMEKGGMPAVPGFSPDLSSVGVSSSSEGDFLVQRRLWITEAKRLGIQFDDASVKRFLQKFADGKVNGSTILATMNSSTDRQMTMQYFSRVLKEELTFQEMLRLVNSGIVFEDVRNARPVAAPALTPPSKNWREFLRLNREAKIQTYPVYVKDFISQVQNKPSDKELKELYNAGKDIVRTSNTLDSEPAFRTPAMATVEFLVVDMEKVIADEMAKFPEETLRAEYERRVAQKDFRVPIEVPKTEDKPVDPITDPVSPSPTVPVPSTPENSPAAVPSQPTVPPSANPEGAAPTTTPPAETTPTPSPAPAEEPAKTESPAEAPKPPVLEDPKASVNTRNANGIRLVNYQEEANPPAQPPADPAPAGDIPQNPLREQQDAPKPEGAKPEGEPATPPAATPAPQTSEATPATTAEPSVSVGAPEAPAQEPTAEVTPMRTKTFDEVKLQIAREMAEGPAVKSVDDKINQIYSQMSVYQAERKAYLRAVEEKAKGVEKPTKPDLEAIGKDMGFDYGTTGMVDSETIQLNPLGQSSVSRGQREQPIPVPRFIDATQGAGEAFTPLASFASGIGASSRYLFWKTEIKESAVPSFDAVKDRVQEVWTVQQAIKLAETKARETATRIGTGKIEDVLATEEEKKLIVEPAPFAAMNKLYAIYARFGAQSSFDEVNRVDPLLPVDKSFMETVFAAKPGDTVFAPDRRKSVFYVVKVLEYSPSSEVLFEKFQNAPTEGVANLGFQESRRAIFPVFQDIQKRLGYREN